MKQKEFSHIKGELERLGLEAREREQRWEEKFLVTAELRDSQDDLWATLDERLRGIEQRLITIEQNCVQRPELDRRFQVKVDEVKELRQQVDGHFERVEAVSIQLADQQEQLSGSLVTKNELAECQNKLNGDIGTCQERISSGLDDLRNYSVSKSDLENYKGDVDVRCTAIENKLNDTVEATNVGNQMLDVHKKYCEDTYCSQTAHDESFAKLREDEQATNAKVKKMLDDLEDTKATKREVQEVSTTVRTSLTELNQTAAKTSSGLDRTSGTLAALEQRLDQNFATRKYVDDSVKNSVEEVVERSDTREELGRVWKELEQESQRLRQTVRMQQDTRNDLNGALDDIQGVRNRALDLERRCDALDASVSEVDARETKHWESGQEMLRQQSQVHADLNNQYSGLRDEFVSNKEYHRSEAEKLKNHSTMRYMEQIDKALNLTKSVEEVRRVNKLPPVSP
jgi:chromosome segregation ATPase